MGKNNKKGNNSKKQEVAKQNEEVNEVNNAEIVENVEQVEQAEIEPTDVGSISEAVGEAVEQHEEPKESDSTLPQKPKFTKKNGETERKVAIIRYNIDVISAWFKKSESFSEEEKEEVMKHLEAAKEIVTNGTAEKIAEENAILAEQIKSENAVKNAKKSETKRHDAAVKALMEIGMTKEQAEEVVARKGELSPASSEE